MPQGEPAKWPDTPRIDATVQSLIRLDQSGLRVTVLKHGKPAAIVDVKLYNKVGPKPVSRPSDGFGVTVFSTTDLKPGLNAILFSFTDNDSSGTLLDEASTSTTDYATASFNRGDSDAQDYVPDSLKPKLILDSEHRSNHRDYPTFPRL